MTTSETAPPAPARPAGVEATVRTIESAIAEWEAQPRMASDDPREDWRALAEHIAVQLGDPVPAWADGIVGELREAAAEKGGATGQLLADAALEIQRLRRLTASAPAPDADALTPRAGERRVAAFDVRIYASPRDPSLPERIATSYRAVVRGVETGTVAEATSPVGSWALLRALREGARLVRELEQENEA